MSDADRIAQLEATVADLLKRVDPQNMRQALERTWDPQGGTPRVVDENGATLDYAPSLQFLNSTSTVDPQTQRVIITPSGGGGTPSFEFSDDGSTTGSERLRFASQSGPAASHYDVDTLTVGGARIVQAVVTEDTSAPVTFAAVTSSADDAGAAASTSVFINAATSAQALNVAASDGAAFNQLSAIDQSSGSESASVTLSHAAGSDTAVLEAVEPDLRAAVDLASTASVASAEVSASCLGSGTGIQPIAALTAAAPDELAQASVLADGGSAAGRATVEAAGDSSTTATLKCTSSGVTAYVSADAASGPHVVVGADSEQRQVLTPSGDSDYAQSLVGVTVSHAVYVDSIYDAVITGVALPLSVTIPGVRPANVETWVGVGRVAASTALAADTAFLFASSGTADVLMTVYSVTGAPTFAGAGSVHAVIVLSR